VNNVVRPTMNKLSTMLFQVVTVEQCCNNMLTILFIVGRTTLFTPVDINLEQVVDFLNFYACTLTCSIPLVLQIYFCSSLYTGGEINSELTPEKRTGTSPSTEFFPSGRTGTRGNLQ
jgi:hypothetical protein